MKLKLVKYVFLCIAIFLLSIFAYYILRERSVPVLAYHDFSLKKDLTDDNRFVSSIEEFEKQMKYIKSKGYKTLTMEEFYLWKTKGQKLPPRSVLITFDDGAKSIYTLVCPILKKYNINATSFVIGNRALSSPEENNFSITLAEIDLMKSECPTLEFHSHSYDLHSRINEDPMVLLKTKTQLKEDCQNLEKIIPTKYIAYPFGKHTDQFIEVLKSENYKLGFIYYSPYIRARRSHDDFKVPRVTLDRGIQFWRFKMALKVGLPSKANLLLK